MKSQLSSRITTMFSFPVRLFLAKIVRTRDASPDGVLVLLEYFKLAVLPNLLFPSPSHFSAIFQPCPLLHHFKATTSCCTYLSIWSCYLLWREPFNRCGQNRDSSPASWHINTVSMHCLRILCSSIAPASALKRQRTVPCTYIYRCQTTQKQVCHLQCIWT